MSNEATTPKAVITKVMRERMRGERGHDLSDEEFFINADEIIGGLEAAGFKIVNVEKLETLSTETKDWLSRKAAGKQYGQIPVAAHER